MARTEGTATVETQNLASLQRHIYENGERKDVGDKRLNVPMFRMREGV
jgi:hypothetical protein